MFMVTQQLRDIPFFLSGYTQYFSTVSFSNISQMSPHCCLSFSRHVMESLSFVAYTATWSVCRSGYLNPDVFRWLVIVRINRRAAFGIQQFNFCGGELKFQEAEGFSYILS